MKYKFEKIDFSYGAMPKDRITYDYGVNYDSLEEKEKTLFQIAWDSWTPEEIQMIINRCKNLKDKEEYKYQVPGSDLLIIIDKDEAHFFDMHSDKKEADIIWSFSEFIDFMEQFKKFVTENS